MKRNTRNIHPFRRILKLTTVIFFIFFTSCKTSKSSVTNQSPQEALVLLTSEKYGNEARILMNKSKSYALVLKATKATPASASASIHFFLFEMDTKEIILEDFIHQGSVQWENDTHIRVKTIAGRYSEENSSGYLFNTETNEKTH